MVELFDYTLQIPAEKIVVQNLAFGIHAVLGLFFPAFMQPFSFPYDHVSAGKKSVREDLVHDPALKPVGGGKICPADDQLIRRCTVIKDHFTEFSATAASAVYFKIIKIQPNIRKAQGDLPALRRPLHMLIFGRFPVLLKD